MTYFGLFGAPVNRKLKLLKLSVWQGGSTDRLGGSSKASGLYPWGCTPGFGAPFKEKDAFAGDIGPYIGC